MIPIVFTTLTATSTGRVVRCVTCESCQADYVFTFDATAKGTSTSLYGMGMKSVERKAIREAQAAVDHELKTGVRVVPCPSCGWYQAHMVDELRNRIPPAFGLEAMGLLGVAILMMVLGNFAAIKVLTAPKHVHVEAYAAEFWFGVAGLGLICFLTGCYVIRRRMSRRAGVNPNDTVPLDVRLERGRAKAMLHSDFAQHFPGVDVVRFPPSDS